MSAQGPDLAHGTPDMFFNRELSWLEFDERVMREARDPSVPLLERLKFVAIAASNLDEFFMVRVAGLVGQVRDRVTTVQADGMTPADQLSAIAARVARMRAGMSEAVLTEVLPGLAVRGVRVLQVSALGPEGHAHVVDHFHRQVMPVLTPLAIDPGHPFPHLRNKSLNLIAILSGTGSAPDVPAFAVVQVPQVLPRLVRVPQEEVGGTRAAYVLLDDIIAAFMGDLFPGFECRGAWAFRVIRNFDLSIDEEEAEDLLESIQAEMRRRDRGNAVAVLVDSRADPSAIEMLRESVSVDPQYMFRVDGPLNLPDLSRLAEALGDDASLRDEPFVPQRLPPFRNHDDVFAVIAQGDVLLHHPYESFDPVVELIEQAAVDPHVLAIKQTLYRTSGDSPIVKALMRAAENHKQVTALVEIKARFDEENNIAWARRMEEAGVHVVYGLVGLKTHAKAALVVRREGNDLRRYVHLGTGNYNPSTARLYTDLSYFTCNAEFGEDASSLFNLLTSCTAPAGWKKLIVAPLGLHERILGLIEREAQNARAGKPARIIAKMNSLVDPDVILALYRASQAGVSIDLIVRGICCLKAGVPGVSENIRVRALLDRFLEHARIFVFEAGGAHEVYCSSADWMPRNFHRRVEVLFPIENPALRARIVDEVLAVELADDVKAHVLNGDGTYARVPRHEGKRAQVEFLKRARAGASIADERERHDRPFVVRPVRNRPTLGVAALVHPTPLEVPAPLRDSRESLGSPSIPAPRDSNPDGFRVPAEPRDPPSREIALPHEPTKEA
ncbi:MAG: polyphosphate kinase 1 [Deltaproteobacteria bacterium]|nr:polyphosphate kinase 1 [Deltaproteobacteria bacterium]